MGNAPAHQIIDDHDHIKLSEDLAKQIQDSNITSRSTDLPHLPPLVLVPTVDGKFIVRPRPTHNQNSAAPGRTLDSLQRYSAPGGAVTDDEEDGDLEESEAEAAEKEEEIPDVSFEGEDNEEEDAANAAGKKWRKYGCKKLKNSKDHRNYFRCTHGSCPAKKIVEVRFSNARPNDPPAQNITIRGTHNHAEASLVRFEAKTQAEFKAIVNMKIFAPVSSEVLVKQERVRNEDSDHDMKNNPSSGEVLVELSSEVNPADDGWQWRKYGRKVVKHSDRTRNYFKCSLKTCPARKKVQSNAPAGTHPPAPAAEPDGSDPAGHLVSYEERHNHPQPTNARMVSNHINALLKETKAAPTTTTTTNGASVSSTVVPSTASAPPVPPRATSSSSSTSVRSLPDAKKRKL